MRDLRKSHPATFYSWRYLFMPWSSDESTDERIGHVSYKTQWH